MQSRFWTQIAEIVKCFEKSWLCLLAFRVTRSYKQNFENRLRFDKVKTKFLNYENTLATCTTLRNDDVSLTSSKCSRYRKVPGKRNDRVYFAVTVASKFARFRLATSCKEYCKIRCTRIADLDDLKNRIRTGWAKLHHTIIAAAVRQWHGRLSACQGWRWSFL